MDTVYDFLGALERADGYGMLGTFSESLEGVLQARLADLQELALRDPGTAGRLAGMLLPGISARDLQGMSLGGFLSLLLLQVDPSGYDAYGIDFERIEMRGSNAVVLVGWDSGDSLRLEMVWEDGVWKINSAGLLGDMFDGL